MIVKENFYNVECDYCHELADVDVWSVEEQTAKEKALDYDWRELGSKHYCPDCWELDDDENIVTKDGKVWDWDTEEFLRNTEE